MASRTATHEIILRQWHASVDYEPVWHAMRTFTRSRDQAGSDELWLLEHNPVYTLGIRGQADQPVSEISGIPVVQSDRGGLITYHGPGQVVIYVLIDIRRRKLGLKALVELLEQAVIDVLAGMDIDAGRRDGAPGVYVGGRKLASLGLRMINGRTYHGISMNVDMDLAPFERIDPCGYEGLEMTDLARLGVNGDLQAIGRVLAGEISRLLGYTHIIDAQPDREIQV